MYALKHLYIFIVTLIQFLRYIPVTNRTLINKSTYINEQDIGRLNKHFNTGL